MYVYILTKVNYYSIMYVSFCIITHAEPEEGLKGRKLVNKSGSNSDVVCL